MTEQTNTESAQPQGTSVPTDASQGSGQATSAGATGEVSVQELSKRLETLERLQQSEKDRAIAKLRKEVDDKFAELSGKPVVKEAAAAPTDTGTVSPAQAIPEALARFQEVGLSVSDPSVAGFLAQSGAYKSREAMLLEAERIINRTLIKPSVSAAVAVSAAATPPPAASTDQLTAEYRSKMMAARGKPSEVRRIKAEYAQKGVPVDNVIFS